MSSNLPPGVTDAMIEDRFSTPARCEECEDYESCPFDGDDIACAETEAADAMEGDE